MTQSSALADIVQRTSKARATAERALKENPRDPNIARAAAALFDGIGDYDRALSCILVAAELAPNDAGVQLQRAIILQHIGDFNGAKSAYETTAKLAPLAARAHLGIAEMSEPSDDPGAAERFAQVFAAVREDPIRELVAGHAVAKTLEKRGEYAASFDWLVRAKQSFAQTRRFDLDNARAVHEAASNSMGKAAPGFSEAAPIFIVGLPRTGTTLVDRVVSSHPDVRSAGELSNLLILVNCLAGAPLTSAASANVLEKAQGFDFDVLGRSYIESVLSATQDQRRFVDKAPLNYLLAPIIHQALPNARIVCMRRDPADACMSMFKQLLPVQHNQYDFAFRIEDAARYVALFERLTSRLKATLPPERYLEIRYERFVEDFEPQARALIAFLGLAWDDRCLAFHENKSPVATPSARQVRQPIYASSIGHWRRYGEAFSPALEVFRSEGIAV